jgi:hypothetical protein
MPDTGSFCKREVSTILESAETKAASLRWRLKVDS